MGVNKSFSRNRSNFIIRPEKGLLLLTGLEKKEYIEIMNIDKLDMLFSNSEKKH